MNKKQNYKKRKNKINTVFTEINFAEKKINTVDGFEYWIWKKSVITKLILLDDNGMEIDDNGNPLEGPGSNNNNSNNNTNNNNNNVSSFF